MNDLQNMIHTITSSPFFALAMILTLPVVTIKYLLACGDVRYQLAMTGRYYPTVISNILLYVNWGVIAIASITFLWHGGQFLFYAIVGIVRQGIPYTIWVIAYIITLEMCVYSLFHLLIRGYARYTHFKFDNRLCVINPAVYIGDGADCILYFIELNLMSIAILSLFGITL